MKTIVDNLEKKLGELGEKKIGVEGYSEGKWVLVDSGDVVAHVFHKSFRGFYNLESLWSDAPQVKLSFDDEIERRRANTVR